MRRMVSASRGATERMRMFGNCFSFGIGTVLVLALVALLLVGFIEFLARGATPETADEPSAV